jgi:uroporphyrinogen III methyltransferase/synthase
MSNDEPRPTPPRPRLPLAGLTVLVPRAKEQAGTLSELLRQRGAEPLEVPTIEIRPVGSTAELDRAVRLLASGFYDWVVLTSVNGVAALRGRVEAAGLDARALNSGEGGRRTRVAAVGPATEKALAAWGVQPDLVPPVATTADLGSVFPPGPGEVLLTRADVANPELRDVLVAKGWRTDEVVAYHTVPLDRMDAEARRRLDRSEVDWIAFTAPSTITGFVRAYGGPPPAGVSIAAIGPVTAAAAEAAGMRVSATASEHTIPGLVRAIEEGAALPPRGAPR